MPAGMPPNGASGARGGSPVGEARIGRKRPGAPAAFGEWDDASIAERRRLWGGEMTTEQMARRMGRSKGSIIGKAHRLGLPGRPSPIKRHAGPVTAPTERALVLRQKRGQGFAPRLVATLPPVVLDEAAVMTPAQVKGLSAPRPASAAFVLHKSQGLGKTEAMLSGVVQAAAHVPGTGCRFPMWGLKERATQVFCDKPRRKGRDGTANSSFCAECHRRCYLTPAQHAAEQRMVGREASYAMARARLT
jgi:GcrA cell cycle regulator